MDGFEGKGAVWGASLLAVALIMRLLDDKVVTQCCPKVRHIEIVNDSSDWNVGEMAFYCDGECCGMIISKMTTYFGEE